MSDSPASSQNAVPNEPGIQLRRKLGAVRRKLVRVEFMRRMAVALIAALLGLALIPTVDWLVELPLEARAGILIGLVIVVSFLLLRALVALVTQRRDEETLALMVEKEEPGFQSRLIASVQFARGKATVSDGVGQLMVERTVRDTASYAGPLRLTKVVKTQRLKRALVILLLLGAFAGGGYQLGGSLTKSLLERAFLSDVPIPRATDIVWTSGDLRVGIGDDVTLEAQVQGFEPEAGTLRVRYSSGRRQSIRMERGKEGNRYVVTLENIQESFTFQVAIKDGRSDRQEVITLPRPSVEQLVGKQRYPDYMGLPPSDHRPGEFLLYPGSELLLSITASQPLANATVRLLGELQKDSAVAVVTPENPLLAEVVLPVPGGLTGFTVELLDEEGMESRDATVYRVDVLSDEPPKVRLVRPSRQRELVTAKARLLVGYEAEDRFGVDRVALCYQLGKEGEVKTFNLPLTEQGAARISETFDWRLDQVEPTLVEGDEIEFWIEAHDQSDRTEEGRSTSRILKVVTPREKRDDLLSRAGDSLRRIDRATSEQDRLNTALADWIRARRDQPAAENPEEPGSKIEKKRE
ncbi:MAG: hypothetical protein CMP30_08205 [Roseibacillus sp.]|nr:hypothetical protein [Roseibacillus sp.]